MEIELIMFNNLISEILKMTRKYEISETKN